MNGLIILSKDSTESQIRAYFLKVLELKQSNEQFPVDLEEVWPLVYGTKGDAVNVLKAEFIIDVDYQVFRQNPKNPLGGRPTDIYKLTLSCMEYFIVRKVQPVFNVYRSVFHQSVESGFKLPQTFSEALRLAADKTEENERLMIENRNKDRIIEEQAPAVIFKQSVEGSSTDISVERMAKKLCQNGIDIGQNRLFDWFVDNGYLICHKRWSKKREKYINDYTATQRAADLKVFFEVPTVINPGSSTSFTKHTIKVTGKGQVYFTNKFLNNQQ